MRQSIGGNKWGGLRSAYWLQPVSFAESSRIAPARKILAVLAFSCMLLYGRGSYSDAQKSF